MTATLGSPHLILWLEYMDNLYLWDNQAKWVWPREHHNFSFLLSVILLSKSYILQKIPLKLYKSFQSYDLLKGHQNNRKQKALFPLFGSISKSTFANSDSFCLITPHLIWKLKLVLQISWPRNVQQSLTAGYWIHFYRMHITIRNSIKSSPWNCQWLCQLIVANRQILETLYV